MNRGALLLIGIAFIVPRLAHAQEATAEVSCKDGTKSKGGKGACSGHGGVDKSASKAGTEPAEKSASTSKSKSKSTAASATSSNESGSSGKSGSSSKSKSTAASATSAAAPAAAEAGDVTCKDGTTSHGGKGACSGHGGVDKNASPSKSGAKASASTVPAAGPAATASPEPAPTHAVAPAPAATATAPATKTPASAGQKGPPTAKCKDGSLSYAQHHTGACSNHGGVAEWLDGTQK